MTLHARKERPAPRLNRRWRSGEDEVLVRMSAEGAGDAAIADAVNAAFGLGRTTMSVSQRRQRLGHAGRVRPKQKPWASGGPRDLPSAPAEPSPERERLMSRCRQLAAALAAEGGSMTWHGLLRVVGANYLEHLLGQAPGWFAEDAMGLSVTEAGRCELLGGAR